ncbi:HAD-superfamily hydrolase-like protein [Clohesyomyces aquaticus]|uniref:HAD-superfamily hydrolase-like protein n=1 Tax=Clohesyomyces aquaticus TaxID=1231657 RepID=A0A1Y2A940_9PLEO|nr:HAD-superfamily hydrolase-like protein [Clohesyomyces aquaticus]
MGKVKYILLDCDNTLAQSEHLAFEACADLTNEVMKIHNIDAKYTGASLLEDFVGHNFRSMLRGLQKKHNFTMSDDEMDEFVGRELAAVTAKLSEKAVECPGVTKELTLLKELGYPMSVVSTSAKSRVVASIKKIGIDHFFPDEHVYSAASSLDPPSSKPDPAIYIHACKELGVQPHECVTVEDSKSGATAAMRAGIPCIAYVGIYGIEEGKEKMEQMAKLLTEETKCVAVMYDWAEFQDCLKVVESKL